MKAITGLLTSFPQVAADRENFIKIMVKAVADIPDGAVVMASKRYIRGEVPKHDPRFAPSVAEFCNEARQQEALSTHKHWLAQNRASIAPRVNYIPSKAMTPARQKIIDTYRANYQERLKTEPNLTYPDSIRRDFKTATGQTLNIPNPTVSA